jgi:hypothetical protein
MNAVLQCLSHTDILAEYFVLDQYKVRFIYFIIFLLFITVLKLDQHIFSLKKKSDFNR